MYKKLLFGLLLVCFSGASSASGWYYMEAGLGNYQGHYQTSKVTGLGFDFKLGLNWGKMFFGADIGYADSLNVSGVTYALDMNNIGFVVGYNSNSLKVWYTMVSSATNSYKSGATEFAVTGAGSKLGVGGKISSSTYLNLEANFLKYDQLSTDGVKTDIDQFMDVVLLSVSWML